MRLQNLICRLVGGVAAIAAIPACTLTQSVLPPDAGSSCASSITAAEVNSWFDSGAASLNGPVKPANSVTFPDTPNCSFYKWSEQMFLWLTSPAPPRYGSTGGMIMNSNAFFDVSLPDATGQREFVPHSLGAIRAFNVRTAQRGILDLPVVLQKGSLRLLEVLPPVLAPSGRPLVQDSDGNEVEVADARFARERVPVLIDPAGREIKAPRALLRSRGSEIRPLDRQLERLEGFDRSELVQKFMLKDRVVLLDLFGNFQETEQGQADGGVLMAQNGSLVYYALTVNNVFALYRTMQGATVQSGKKFPVSQTDLNTVTAFASAHGQPTVIDPEALAIEVKSSWVEAAGLVDADKFIQMKAIVPTYDKTNPADWVPNGTQVVNLAMVGLHVVGSTKGHPEMLWATFEHVSNNPAAAYTYSKTPSGTTTISQNTAGTWVFTSNGAAAPFNEQHLAMGGPAGNHVVAVPPFAISPSNILRTMPWGASGTNANSNAEVLSINSVVRSTLDPADLRKNYFHEGTTWTIFGAPPSATNQVGTNKLENTTMETFNQGGNCFGCHVTNTTAVSHVFNSTKPLF